jgi:hypothetical protein
MPLIASSPAAAGHPVRQCFIRPLAVSRETLDPDDVGGGVVAHDAAIERRSWVWRATCACRSPGLYRFRALAHLAGSDVSCDASSVATASLALSSRMRSLSWLRCARRDHRKPALAAPLRTATYSASAGHQRAADE